MTGVVWTFFDLLMRRGVGLITTLLLAYFLTPADFGLVAMMAVFIAVATGLMDSGFKQALIRLKTVDDSDLSTAFAANLLLGVIAYGLLYACAPAIAAFYETPELIKLVRVAGIGVLINSFQVVQMACFHRAMDFKALIKINVPAAVISGLVAIAAAYLGLGVWALVIQMLTSSFLITGQLWLKSSWRPTASFSRDSFRRMYSFGYKLFLSGTLDTIFKNMFVVVIAKLFTAPVAGLYFFADRIKELLSSQLVSAIQSVTYPALSGLQDDNTRLKEAYRKIIRITAFIYFPIILLMAAMAPLIFEVALPEKWAGAALYLQLMCLAVLLYPLHAINLNILKVKGRSDLFLGLEVGKKLAVLVILFVSYRFGVVGILIGQIVGSVLFYIPNGFFALRLVGYRFREQLADFLPQLTVAAFVAATMVFGELAFGFNSITKVVVLSMFGAFLYIFLSHFFRVAGYRLAKALVQQRLVVARSLPSAG